jgi:hypothetical protein
LNEPNGFIREVSPEVFLNFSMPEREKEIQPENKPLKPLPHISSYITLESSYTGLNPLISSYITPELEEIIKNCLPQEPGNNHFRIFDLAFHMQRLKSKEEWTLPEKRAAICRWCELNPFTTGTDDDYEAEFFEAWDNVKLAGGVFEKAWARAQATEPPELAAQNFRDRKYLILASLCRELGALWEKKPFPLSCATVQKCFELKDSMTAWRMLDALKRHGIIETATVGIQGQAPGLPATTYFYTGKVKL